MHPTANCELPTLLRTHKLRVAHVGTGTYSPQDDPPPTFDRSSSHLAGHLCLRLLNLLPWFCLKAEKLAMVPHHDQDRHPSCCGLSIFWTALSGKQFVDVDLRKVSPFLFCGTAGAWLPKVPKCRSLSCGLPSQRLAGRRAAYLHTQQPSNDLTRDFRVARAKSCVFGSQQCVVQFYITGVSIVPALGSL